MNINAVRVGEFLISYDIQNVKSIDRNGQKSEKVQIVAQFTKNGEVIHTVYNLGNAEMVAKLLDRDFAIKKAGEMIEEANKSAHSMFLK